MHGTRTRTTAKILVGAAVAALTGCVSVDAPPTAPVSAPAAETVSPARDVAPQIGEGPALEALEAALPAPPPSPTPTPLTAPTPESHRGTPAPPRAREPRPESAPPRRESPRPAARPALPELPTLPLPADLPTSPPVSRADVCDLGERYGGWAPGSDRSRICHGTHGR
ncbi:hypothetical protein [Streptomyces zaomyceticus]|uniref:hypothetical protein n=1 Tax=Streptomyces zaomyceticus TaxID=68286 RepID=UPI001677B500|nr:hypothetical protein [Streptomyces zaomyceticus]GHG08166.1 hypothetical protein GCM10018791_21080 [Streptomyces zaomyceticus]